MKNNEKIALFAGSFDPFTAGHAALVDSALKFCDKIIIGIGTNINKRGLLSSNSRKRLIEDLYRDKELYSGRIEVAIYEGLTGDFARQIGATILIRGVRNAMDLENERTIECVNRTLYPEIQTVMLFTPAELMHVSSSSVRELMAYGKEIDSMMPQGIEIEDYIE